MLCLALRQEEIASTRRPAEHQNSVLPLKTANPDFPADGGNGGSEGTTITF